MSATTIRHRLHRVAERAETALGDERWSFIDGCPAEWAQLPRPPASLTVGLDGGYVRDWADKRRHFEVIVGKAFSDERPSRYFGLVQGYDSKPRRRLFEVLRDQGLQFNQQLTFLSDGGDTVRDLQLYLSPEAEHVLDWFHVAMRLTVLGQYAKGLPRVPTHRGQPPPREEALTLLERTKHYLWHGDHDWEGSGLEPQDTGEIERASASIDITKLKRGLAEFRGYLQANEAFIPNYGERWRQGEAIATGFVESTVNAVVSKRMVKKQQMQWTPRGSHLLLQVRTKVLNGELDDLFREWYPSFRRPPIETRAAAA